MNITQVNNCFFQPWWTLCPTHPRALPHAPPNNMLIVPSLSRRPTTRQCPHAPITLPPPQQPNGTPSASIILHRHWRPIAAPLTPQHAATLLLPLASTTPPCGCCAAGHCIRRKKLWTFLTFGTSEVYFLRTIFFCRLSRGRKEAKKVCT